MLGCSLKNKRIISVHFQGKLFNITVIQVYAPTTETEETEADQFFEDKHHLLELTANKKKKKRKRCPFHHRGLECKSRKSRDTWNKYMAKQKSLATEYKMKQDKG